MSHRVNKGGKPRWGVGLLVVWWAAVGVGSVAQAAYRPIRFEQLSLEEGLSQSTVLTLLQDREGYLWVGTESGLNRYDGKSFRQYHHDSAAADSLPGNYVYVIDEDASGDLWIATDGGGVARWERAGDRFTSYRHDPSNSATLASNNVRTLHVDGHGTVWVGTRGQGLDRLDPASATVEHRRHDPSDPSSLSHNDVYAIASDREGRLWIGTGKGLNRLDPATGRLVRYHEPSLAVSLADDQVRSIFEDRQGDIWIGTFRGLVRLRDRGSGERGRFRHDPQDPASLSHDTVRAIFEDDAGRMWIGTDGGLNLLDRQQGRFSRYSHDPARLESLPSDAIMTIRQDRGGVLWIGTQAGGLAKWNPRTWSFGHHSVESTGPEGLSHHVVTSFSVDRTGRAWIGTMGGGLNVLDRATGRWDHHRAGAQGLSDDRVMALLHDHQGKLWIGTASKGVDVFDPASGSFRNLRSDPDDERTLGANAVMSLFEDRDGSVWVGTFGGGASRFDRPTQSFARITEDAVGFDLATARVTAFTQDSAGTLWAGTDGQGLYLLESAGDILHRFVQDPDDPAALTSNIIYGLHTDVQGVVWVGMRGGWLDRVEGSSEAPEEVEFRHFGPRDGLLNADVYGIESDSGGQLWLSTNRGLTRFDPGRGSAKHYNQSHGLQAEFNFGAHYRSADGDLFFGGIQGFNVFSPASLEANDHEPQVVLRALSVNNAPVAVPRTGSGTDGIELGYRDDVVTFDFAALDFAATRENRYAYMLQGFDSDWVEIGNESRVTYTNLDAGSYLLRVKAANNDGLWSSRPLEIPLTVEPAPWKTWWAYSAYVAAALLAAVVFVRNQQLKVKREAEYSRKLETEVATRTRELRDRNEELAALNEKLEEASLTDPLTGLRNRRFLFEQVTKDISLVRRRYQEIAAGQKEPEVFDLVFMMVDLDRFKTVNDSFGHATGDRMLLAVRDVLLETCRESDIVIRWGGDEFLVVARDADPAMAEGLAERLRARIEAKVLGIGDGRQARTTCSIGFACFPFLHSRPDVLSWDNVIQLADGALYRAKATRNAWIGYLSTAKAADAEPPVSLERVDTEELIERGALEVRRSEAA